MSECEKLGSLVSAYLDGELSPQDAAEVERHLAQCGQCSRTVADFRAAAEAARDVPMPADPAWERLWDRIEPRASVRPAAFARGWSGRFWLAAAAGLLIAFCVFGLARRRAQPDFAIETTGFEVVSIEVASADYTPVVMAVNGGSLPVIMVEGI